MRYTVKFLECHGMSPSEDYWRDDYRSSWESMDFKTMAEVQAYINAGLFGERYVIIDNANQKIITEVK